jgi:NADH-quinone oxidoreductase subunit G
MTAELPALEPVSRCAPGAGYRSEGMKVSRYPHRCSGRTSMTANLSVREPKPPADDDTPFSFSMEGADTDLPPALMPRYWSPGWNSVQAFNKFRHGASGEPVGGDAGVRLFEGAGGTGGERPPGRSPYHPCPPLSGERKIPRGEFLILPRFHVFGSEELSAAAEGIASRSPRPYVGLSGESAEELGISEGAEAKVESVSGGQPYTAVLPVRIVPGLPPNCALLPAGLPGTEWLDLPARGKVAAPDNATTRGRRSRIDSRNRTGRGR